MERVYIHETNLKFSRPLETRDETDMIVLHHTGAAGDAGAKDIHCWHLNNGWAGIGYHFVIRKDGRIETGRPIDTIGAHAYGENYHTIGVHLSGDFNTERPTSAQIESAAMLTAALCEEYDISIDREHIVGHRDLMATSCPGEKVMALLDDGTLIGKAIFYTEQSIGD